MNNGFGSLWLSRLKRLKRWARLNRPKRLKRATKSDHLFVLVSYPKSGRTWLRIIFGELEIPFDRSHSGASGSKARTFEELKLFRKEKPAGTPIVFLFRDPRDTVVSAYFWETHRVNNPYAGSIAEFIRDPSHGIEKIIRFNLAWLERGLRLPAFLPITFGEIVANPATVVRRILAFIGVQLPDSKIEQVVANNTFEKLRQREASSEPPLNKKHPRQRDPNDSESYKFRRGKIGGYTNYLSSDDINYCDQLLASHRYFEKIDRLMRDCPSILSSGVKESGRKVSD